MKAPTKTAVNIRLDNAVKRKLQVIAAKENRSLSNLVTQICIARVNQEPKK